MTDQTLPDEPRPGHDSPGIADVLAAILGELRRIADAWQPVELTPAETERDQLRKQVEDLTVTAGDVNEARMWARHGYEIGQRHCGWSDHGVAPEWLTEGFPPHIDSCEHLQRSADLETATDQPAED